MAKKISGMPPLQVIADLMISEKEIRNDEFTAKMVFEKMIKSGETTTMDIVRNRLKRMRESGRLVSRSITENGCKQTAYSIKPD